MAYTGKVLIDHIRRGKTFYPPFTYEGSQERFQQVQWRADILPELLWLALLIKKNGYTRAKELACQMAFFADQVKTYGNKGNYGLISEYGSFSKPEREKLVTLLTRHNLISDIRQALTPLFNVFPKCPMAFLSDQTAGEVQEEDLDELAPVIDECLFRREKLPTLLQGVYYEVLLFYGKLNLAGVPKHDTSVLADYPDSEESEYVAGFMRCCATSIPIEQKMFASDGCDQATWPKYFWSKGSTIGDCVPLKPNGIYPDQVPQYFILFSMEAFRRYYEETRALWDTIFNSYDYDIYSPLRNEILLGLASRIYRTVVQIVSFIPNWTEDIGQVYLRMVVESFIYYTWLKRCGSDTDYKKFYDYGLGQQKLENEHRKAYLKQHGISDQKIDEIVDSMDFLRNHKLPDFVAVNVGSPFSKSLGKLAEEAGIKEFYALVYSPASSVVHGMYDSLDQYYLRVCMNPFHCRHRVPYYWYKSSLSTYGVMNSVSIFDWILKELLEECGDEVPERMPGENYISLLEDEDELKTFSERDNVKQQCDFVERNIASQTK